MSGFFRLVGVVSLAKELKRAIDAAKGQPHSYWVGSAVPYGPFHEFGTTTIVARPHWSPAIAAIAIKYKQTSARDQNEFVNAMILAPRGLVKIIAFDIERKVKQLITSQGIIDTGNYRGSIATGPSEAEALGASLARTIK